MSDEDLPPPSGEKHTPEEPSARTSNGPIQFVLVQQPSASGDCDSIDDLIRKLWPGKEEDASNETPSRKIIIKSSPVNLLLAIVLVLFAGAQLATIIYRIAESPTPEAKQIVLDGEARKQLDRLASAINLDGSFKVTVTNPTASAGKRDVGTFKIDPQIRDDLHSIAGESRRHFPSEPEVKVILVPSPIQTFSPNPASGPQVASLVEKTVPIPPNLEITPCFPDAGGISVDPKHLDRPKCTTPANPDSKQPSLSIVVRYENAGQDDLLLLDTRGYLSEEFRDFDAQGLNGICTNQPTPHQAAPYPMVVSTSATFLLTLT